MIRALGWCSSEQFGVGQTRADHPPLSDPQKFAELVGKPIKYFPRMTLECRLCLCAAALTLKHLNWPDGQVREIGICAGNSTGALAANLEYFRDYAAAGRSLGRGNLFIYTLPTSAISEVAIALALTGPTAFIRDRSAEPGRLVQHAQSLLAHGEADAMLCLWSNSRAAVCAAVCPRDGSAQSFDALVRQVCPS